MPNRVALRLPPLDLQKRKGNVLPHSKPMPHSGPKDNLALHPIPYDWDKYFTRDAATKTFTLKPDIELNQNNALLFYFKDMYEKLTSCIHFKVRQGRHLQSHAYGANLASCKDLQIQ